MIVSKVGVTPAGMPEKEAMTAADGDHGSMSRQDLYDPHGHEMHPQQFVRLVGCHDPRAGHHDAAHRLH
jgi:hypothetical protein